MLIASTYSDFCSCIKS